MTRALRLRVIFLPLGLGGCGALKLGVMNAAGPIAAAEWNLYLRLAVVLIFVAAPVLLLTPLMAWHYRQANKNNKFKPKWNFSWSLEGLIWFPLRVLSLAWPFYCGTRPTGSIRTGHSYRRSRRSKSKR